jgi:formylglycine-generating enzyme required for sulfatase activity
MGSPPTEAGREAASESQHQRRIGRTFALAAKPVTVEEYRRYAAGYGVNDIEKWARTADSPVIGTNWYQAAAYCNWLSQQDGITEDQWCYETNAPMLVQEKMSVLTSLISPPHSLAHAMNVSYFVFLLDRQPEVTALKKDYLGLSGYRLPTEAEVEYGCRAGAVTSRYYGETEELLPSYGWYVKNAQERTWPVGRRKPNDWGLFDMHGNVYSWCQESYLGDYPTRERGEVIEDKEDSLQILSTQTRVWRGGSFYDQAANVRSANRIRNLPAVRSSNIGFRPARTFHP